MIVNNKEGIEKEIMKIMREKLVSNKHEILNQLLKDKKNSKANIVKMLEKLAEKKWITPLYGSMTTFAITQKGIRESKMK